MAQTEGLELGFKIMVKHHTIEWLYGVYVTYILNTICDLG